MIIVFAVSVIISVEENRRQYLWVFSRTLLSQLRLYKFPWNYKQILSDYYKCAKQFYLHNIYTDLLKGKYVILFTHAEFLYTYSCFLNSSSCSSSSSSSSKRFGCTQAFPIKRMAKKAYIVLCPESSVCFPTINTIKISKEKQTNRSNDIFGRATILGCRVRPAFIHKGSEIKSINNSLAYKELLDPLYRLNPKYSGSIYALYSYLMTQMLHTNICLEFQWEKTFIHNEVYVFYATNIWILYKKIYVYCVKIEFFR